MPKSLWTSIAALCFAAACANESAPPSNPSSTTQPASGGEVIAIRTVAVPAGAFGKVVLQRGVPPADFGDLIERMQLAMAAGWVPPKVAIAGVPQQLEAQLVDDVQKSPVYQPLSVLYTGASWLKLRGSPNMKSPNSLPV